MRYPIILTVVLVVFCASGCTVVQVDRDAGRSTVEAHDRRTTGTMVEDTAIEFKAESLLKDDPEINAQGHVSVVSYNGHALLVGQVPSEAAKIRAEEIMHNFTKVTRVYNELAIAAPSAYLSRTGDAYVTSKVKSKIIAEKTLTASHFKVVTENGVVYLMGIVTQEEANTAIEITRNTGGVQRVVPLFEIV